MIAIVLAGAGIIPPASSLPAGKVIPKAFSTLNALGLLSESFPCNFRAELHDSTIIMEPIFD